MKNAAQHDITEELLSQLTPQELESIGFSHEQRVLYLRRVLWYNTVSMRLTRDGFMLLHSKFGLTAYEFHEPDPRIKWSYRMLVGISRNIRGPYYLDLRLKTAYLFGKRDATIAMMYGSFSEYIDSLHKGR